MFDDYTDEALLDALNKEQFRPRCDWFDGDMGWTWYGRVVERPPLKKSPPRTY